MTYQVTIEPNASAEDINFLNQKIRTFNYEKTGWQGIPLTIFLRDEQQQIVGGLRGWFYGGGLFVDVLYLDENLRGLDYGTQLMQLAEQEALKNNCIFINTDTYSFQALPFYQKLGFTIFGELNYLPPIKRFFLKKAIVK